MYYIQNRDEKGLVEYVKNFGSTLILSDTTKADRHWIYKNVSKKDVYFKKVYTNKDNEVRFLMVDSSLLPDEDVDFDKSTVKLVAWAGMKNVEAGLGRGEGGSETIREAWGEGVELKPRAGEIS